MALHNISLKKLVHNIARYFVLPNIIQSSLYFFNPIFDFFYLIRPVYLQKRDTITGHFLICYLAVLLTRLLQIHILNDNFGSEEIFDFMHDFRVAKISDRKYINLARSSPFIKELATKTSLPLTSYFLANEDIKKMVAEFLCHHINYINTLYFLKYVFSYINLQIYHP